MGRGTYFNPERQDEAISQYLTKQSDANANTAHTNTMNAIMNAINGYRSNATGYGGMIANQQKANEINNTADSKGMNQLGNIAQMLPQIAMMFA